MMDTPSLGVVIVVLVGYYVSWIFYARFFHPYARIPGPFLASISRLWLVRAVRGGKAHVITRELHEKYGRLVRIAPDEASVSDPQAINIIYGFKAPFVKTGFYDTFGGDLSPNGSLFTIKDEKHHAQRRKIFNGIYTTSSVLEQEHFVESCLKLFDQRMAQFADSGEVVDFGTWLWKYTFDVIGELFFGSHFGFMANDVDHGGWMETLEALFSFAVLTGILPRYLRGASMLAGLINPTIRKGIPAMSTIVKASVACVAERQSQVERQEPTRRDMLAKIFEIYEADRSDEKKPNSHKVLLKDVQSEALAAIGAGSETTAIALRAIFYNLLTHPSSLEKLLAEIDSADRDGRLSRPYVRYTEAIKLPYMIACCKEGMRMHPSIALAFPRFIPPGGVEIAGTFLSAGYKVGINPAVVQFDRDIFGETVDEFIPERWLQGDAARMDRHMMVFGAGKRNCLGINIALVEMYKLLPQFLREFHVELANPGKKLRTHNSWQHRQYGFEVRVSRRH